VSAGSGAIRVRRARHLVAYWRRGRLILHNYASGERVGANPLLCRVLDFCGEWRTSDQIRSALGLGDGPLALGLIRQMTARSLLERSDRRRDPRARAMDAFDAWNPEAGFFHSATKDVRFWSPLEAKRQARRRAREWPMPRPAKRYRGAETIDLPRPAKQGDFPAVLLSRRTWRRFSNAPVTLAELATLLGLTAGVQQWVRSPPRDAPLKTSPSGGARHPVECYVVARTIKGLRAGLYHYAADRHALERLRGPMPAKRIAAYYPASGYFAKASAQVLFTAVFERQLWRYPYSRAYRAALIEAGHVCQTFCLTATWLGLAPYCLMGLADSLIERDLGIDGVTESVLYAAGVGRPPRRTGWAPLPSGAGRLETRPNRRL
jgi:SagB-type dehydrogenase family enzyme